MPYLTGSSQAGAVIFQLSVVQTTALWEAEMRMPKQGPLALTVSIWKGLQSGEELCVWSISAWKGIQVQVLDKAY